MSDRLDYPHDCATIQPGESEADWHQRTHSGQGFVEPGTCPTCALTHGTPLADIYWPWGRFDPDDPEQAECIEPMTFASMSEIAEDSLSDALEELADAERKAQRSRRWVAAVRAEVARVDGLLAGESA